MSQLALALVLASAVTHAAWNALLKRRGDAPVFAVLIVAGAAALSLVAGLATGRSALPLASMPYVAVCGLVEGLYFVTLGRALEVLPLGTAYGLSRGGGQLLIWPLSMAVMNEPLTAVAALGAALLSAGLFAGVERTSNTKGLGWTLACAVSIASYPVSYKAALQAGADPFPLFGLSLLGALPVQLVALRQRHGELWRAARSAPGTWVLASCLCAGSFLAFIHALAEAGPARLTALRNTSVVFAAMLGWAAGERLTARAMIAAVCISAGAVLVAW